MIKIEKSHESGLYNNVVNLTLSLKGDNVDLYGIGYSILANIYNQSNTNSVTINITENCQVAYYVYKKSNKTLIIGNIELAIYTIIDNNNYPENLIIENTDDKIVYKLNNLQGQFKFLSTIKKSYIEDEEIIIDRNKFIKSDFIDEIQSNDTFDLDVVNIDKNMIINNYYQQKPQFNELVFFKKAVNDIKSFNKMSIFSTFKKYSFEHIYNYNQPHVFYTTPEVGSIAKTPSSYDNFVQYYCPHYDEYSYIDIDLIGQTYDDIESNILTFTFTDLFGNDDILVTPLFNKFQKQTLHRFMILHDCLKVESKFESSFYRYPYINKYIHSKYPQFDYKPERPLILSEFVENNKILLKVNSLVKAVYYKIHSNSINCDTTSEQFKIDIERTLDDIENFNIKEYKNVYIECAVEFATIEAYSVIGCLNNLESNSFWDLKILPDVNEKFYNYFEKFYDDYEQQPHQTFLYLGISDKTVQTVSISNIYKKNQYNVIIDKYKNEVEIFSNDVNNFEISINYFYCNANKFFEDIFNSYYKDGYEYKINQSNYFSRSYEKDFNNLIFREDQDYLEKDFRIVKNGKFLLTASNFYIEENLQKNIDFFTPLAQLLFNSYESAEYKRLNISNSYSNGDLNFFSAYNMFFDKIILNFEILVRSMGDIVDPETLQRKARPQTNIKKIPNNHLILEKLKYSYVFCNTGDQTISSNDGVFLDVDVYQEIIIDTGSYFSTVFSLNNLIFNFSTDSLNTLLEADHLSMGFLENLGFEIMLIPEICISGGDCIEGSIGQQGRPNHSINQLIEQDCQKVENLIPFIFNQSNTNLVNLKINLLNQLGKFKINNWALLNFYSRTDLGLNKLQNSVKLIINNEHIVDYTYNTNETSELIVINTISSTNRETFKVTTTQNNVSVVIPKSIYSLYEGTRIPISGYGNYYNKETNQIDLNINAYKKLSDIAILPLNLLKENGRFKVLKYNKEIGEPSHEYFINFKTNLILSKPLMPLCTQRITRSGTLYTIKIDIRCFNDGAINPIDSNVYTFPEANKDQTYIFYQKTQANGTYSNLTTINETTGIFNGQIQVTVSVYDYFTQLHIQCKCIHKLGLYSDCYFNY